MTELLHAPLMDLADLEACAARLSQVLRMVESGPPPGLPSVSTTGVAGPATLADKPGLPLLHHRSILKANVGAMAAQVSWSLGTSDGRRLAQVELEASCPPLLGRIVVVERVRDDLSNTVKPGDADANPRIAASLRRLRDLVAGQAAAMRATMSTDPMTAIEAAGGVLKATAGVFAAVALDDMPEDDSEAIVSTIVSSGRPYQHASIEIDDGERETRLLSDVAERSLTEQLTPIVGLVVEPFEGGIFYTFGPVAMEFDRIELPDDPIARLRVAASMATVPAPAWRGDPAERD